MSLPASMMNNQAFHHRYCIPMDSARPILSSELDFFNEGTGKGWSILNLQEIILINKWHFPVPLVTIFTKFDAQVIQQYGDLDNIMDEGDRWVKARENASRTLQEVYLSKILNTNNPPKAYVQLEGGNHGLCSMQKKIMVSSRYGFA